MALFTRAFKETDLHFRSHLSSYKCPKFPQITKKKGEPLKNRNQTEINENTQVNNDIRKEFSYADALKGTKLNKKSNASKPDTQKATPAQSEDTPHSINENDKDNCNGKPFGIMDTVREIRELFADYPFLSELGKQLRVAKGKDRIDVFYQHVTENYE
ncbi:hypothetical protein TNCT_60171 [Trichonephila clavata]|uniref:Uncharacterized protein n=1 Tax=Trichonephila clavata TaxID=2740835 RepID=A0A8X6JAG1_TRICU|nr:hypothetical protein TNCT_60171 [Trichonephila clavata]